MIIYYKQISEGYEDQKPYDPPVTFTFRDDEYEAVYWMYCGNSADLCHCVWIDLSYDGAFLLSYCGEKITIQQSANCEENSFRSKRMRLLRFVI